MALRLCTRCGLFPALLGLVILVGLGRCAEEVFDICLWSCALAIRLETSNSMASMSNIGPGTTMLCGRYEFILSVSMEKQGYNRWWKQRDINTSSGNGSAEVCRSRSAHTTSFFDEANPRYLQGRQGKEETTCTSVPETNQREHSQNRRRAPNHGLKRSHKPEEGSERSPRDWFETATGKFAWSNMGLEWRPGMGNDSFESDRRVACLRPVKVSASKCIVVMMGRS